MWKATGIRGEQYGPHDGTATGVLAQPSDFPTCRGDLLDSSDELLRGEWCFQGEWIGKQLFLWTVIFQVDETLPPRAGVKWLSTMA